MLLVIAASNYLVQFPINDWLTWGAFPYPAAFLINEITNRMEGPQSAKKVVYFGFLWGAVFSFWLATPLIAIASATAFLTAQLLDIYVFNHLRKLPWWYAPFFASLGGSIIDTALFWSIAFWGQPLPILTWAIGDFGVKLVLDLAFLVPFRLAIRKRPLLTLGQNQ